MLEKFLPSRSSRLTNKLTNEPDANVADASRSECNSNQAQAQKFDTGHAIAVNWDGESASEHEQLTRFIHDAAKMEARVRYFSARSRKPQESVVSESMIEPTPEAELEPADSEDLKCRIAELLGRLREDLNWTVVECNGSKWYRQASRIANDAVFDSTVGSWLSLVAADPATPLHMLEELAMSTDADVRTSVADNPTTPAYLLVSLAKDENPDVRFAMAENHNLGESLLEMLLEDDNPYVLARARKTLNRLASKTVVSPNFSRNSMSIVKTAVNDK